jgi:hemerythrin
MAIVTWNGSDDGGEAALDADHRILAALIEQLHDAVETGQSRDVVASVVNVLTEFVEHHFQREEAIFAQAGYPDLQNHASLHRDIEVKIRAIRDRWIAGDRGALCEDMCGQIKKWLTDHVQVADNSYVRWVTQPSDR